MPRREEDRESAPEDTIAGGKALKIVRDKWRNDFRCLCTGTQICRFVGDAFVLTLDTFGNSSKVLYNNAGLP